MKSKTSTQFRRTKATPKLVHDWQRGWLEHPSRAGTRGHELPKTGPAAEAVACLTGIRTPEKEIARLKRIQSEFVPGFRKLYHLGPAVTVFGSARFKQWHPYYSLARALRTELAKAGFATLTGGGPAIMEAASRGAFEAGGTSYGSHIVVPHEQAPSSYIQKNISFDYFFACKLMVIKYSCALAVLPGGLGTRDELFESATLTQSKTNVMGDLFVNDRIRMQ